MKTMANKLCAVCLWTLLICVGAAWPQASSTLAELRGTVTDTNNASIPNATVTLTDAERGTTRAATTDANGEYTFLGLQPSNYDLRVEAAGGNFAASTSRIVLTIGQQANIPIQLSAAGVTVGIDVVAGTEVVETGRTQQSSVINAREIVDLPISRRNFLDLALLTPGVNDSSTINDSTNQRVAQGRPSGLSFGGNNGRGNLVTVDGGPVITSSGGVFETVSQEAVQEFQVLRNSYSAEFGPSQGGIVNTVTKSGTNRITGSAFGLFRFKQLDARNSFDFNPSGKSPFNRQQFGGSFGAPIQKDKTFFFTAAERFNQKQSSFVNIPLSATDLAPTASQNLLLNYLATGPGGAPFAGLATGLRPNLITTNFPRTLGLFNSANGSFPFKTDQTYFSARVDHTFSDRASAFVRVHANKFFGENQATGAQLAVSRGRLTREFNTGILASYTQQLGANTVNELKADFLYANNRLTPNDPNGPQFNIFGFGFFGRDIFLPSTAVIRDYDFIDNVTTVAGNHTVKFGGDLFLINQLDTNETFFGGRFNFQGVIPFASIVPSTVLPSLQQYIISTTPDPVTTGNPLRTQLLGSLATPLTSLQAFNLGLPSVYQQGFGSTTTRGLNARPAIYAQDTWKIAKNFTLNYGLRYSQNREPYGIFRDKKNFQPRAGFSYDIGSNGKTVIRGGAGIYAAYVNRLVSGVIRTLGNPNFQGDNINIVLSTAAPPPGLPSSIAIYQTLQRLTNNFSRTATVADLATLGIVPRANAPLEVRFLGDPKLRTPQSYQFSLAIERDLGAGFSFEASYLHNRGLYLSRNRDVNEFRASLLTIGGNKPCFFRSSIPTTCYLPAGSTITGSDFRVPLRLQDNVYESTGNSFYDAATFVLRRRFSQNISILAHYTLSKTIDDVTDFNSDFSAQNPTNLRDERALSSFDQRHRVVISGVLQAPKFGDSTAAKVFSNFVVSPIFTYGSPRPFNLLAGADLNNDSNQFNDRPYNFGRNTGKGDKFISFDARLSRRFQVSERRYIELIFEGFNLFNRNNFTSVNNVVGNISPNQAVNGLTVDQVNSIFANGGRGIRGNSPTQPLGFTSSANARQFQFGGRFNF